MILFAFHYYVTCPFLCWLVPWLMWWVGLFALIREQRHYYQTLCSLFVSNTLARYAVEVTRIEARSERFDMFIHLDINSDLYPLKVGQKFALLLVPTLNPDGMPDSGYFVQANCCCLLSFCKEYSFCNKGFLWLSIEPWGKGCVLFSNVYFNFMYV